MPKSFRSEVFALCNLLKGNESANKIGDLIKNMSVVVQSDDNKENTISKNSYGDFAQIAKQSNNEFHGFLFLDDNIDTIQLPPFFSAKHLAPEERELLERGHKTLIRLIDLCLSDISGKSKSIADAMNPYFLYREVNTSSDTESILSDQELQPAVTAFKNGKTYQLLVASNFTEIFKRIDVNAMRALMASLEKEINQSLGTNLSNDIRDFSTRLYNRLSSVSDIMFAYSILMLAIKESLKLTCHTMYRAICGIDLFVLNNDNIINIENHTSTTLCDYYKIFSQDSMLGFSGSEMGSIILIDCDMPFSKHVHEFGMVISETINFGGEFGESAKYSFVTINDEMIFIHKLTDTLLKIGLPIFRSN